MKRSFETEIFVEYYTQRFQSDLRTFFDVTSDFAEGSYLFAVRCLAV